VITTGRGGIYIDLQVQPKARNPGVRGIHGERLKVAVAAPADRGKANEATIAVVADLLGVPRAAVTLVVGSASRQKRVHVHGIDETRARDLIAAAVSR
jgi:uncharacterized protein